MVKKNYQTGSGNVYKDLGYLNAKDMQAKAKLCMCIEEIISSQGLKQVEVAEILGINQPKVSAILNGNFEGFSIERLLHFLMLLSYDVSIVIKKKRRKLSDYGKLDVKFA